MRVSISTGDVDLKGKKVRVAHLMCGDNVNTYTMRIWPRLEAQRLLNGSIITRKDEQAVWDKSQGGLRLEHCFGFIRPHLVKYFGGTAPLADVVAALTGFNETESVTVGPSRLQRGIERVWRMVYPDLHAEDNDEAVEACLELGSGMYFDEAERADLEVLTRVHGLDGIRKLLAHRVRLL